MKSDQFLVVANIFPRPITTPEILKKLSDLLYYNQVERRWVNQNWSVTLTVVVKKKTSTLTLILMNRLTWPLKENKKISKTEIT